MIRKVLVANRGEIAVRIMRTLSDLGVASVAVYSESDRRALHAEVADEAYLLGPPPPAESYLRIDRILDAARQSGAEAVHPGYGFLAENEAFAQAVTDAGLIWIGPPPAAMRAMGDKVSARATAIAAGVPVVAGTQGAVDAQGAEDFAREHGYPIAVKAVMGGGGKAFRVARSEADLREALEGASREAQAYFGDASVFLERYVDRPRHVEVQVLADSHGTVAFCGERDCSTQRRHQKLVEEAPSPAVTPQIRETLAQAAVSLAGAVGYRSAGTLEFLLSEQGELSFLEMNTRLQVEHPVTELVTGTDLVAEQIRLADGEPLGYESLTIRGHAIECRINAENPAKGFIPSPGDITAWTEPSGPWVRVDEGFGAGRSVPRDYDSLVAKLICYGTSREQARLRTLRALSQFHIGGIATTIPFHRALLSDPAFVEGRVWTRFVEDDFLARLPALLESLPEAEAPPPVEAGSDVVTRTFAVEVSGRRYDVRLEEAGGPVRRFRKLTKAASTHGSDGAHDEVRAPMQGTILKVVASEGQAVKAGDLLCTLEAMKMENHIVAPRDGTLAELKVEAGTLVETGALIAVIE
ncbi:MAG TPA: biotin carboxylase N-terminal domain-containing protein [Actinomycetota bacterium]|nr:biotin carboxylase N-terminal domain-containing protein [Actinomycetota bacterium]